MFKCLNPLSGISFMIRLSLATIPEKFKMKNSKNKRSWCRKRID